MSLLIEKLFFITDRCQSGPAGYSLFSSQVASDILFYCTWNVRSAQPLVDCGALEKMLNITQKLLINKDSDTILRQEMYCRTVREHNPRHIQLKYIQMLRMSIIELSKNVSKLLFPSLNARKWQNAFIWQFKMVCQHCTGMGRGQCVKTEVFQRAKCKTFASVFSRLGQ